MIVGAGPATLGLLCNAIKTNRYVNISSFFIWRIELILFLKPILILKVFNILIYSNLNRLSELVASGQGIAILEKGLCFGGGDLQNFGINSNTSSNSFLKATYNKIVRTL